MVKQLKDEELDKISGGANVVYEYLTVDENNCIGCGICEGVCPSGAIEVAEVCKINNFKCFSCGACVDNCPVGAIKRNDK